MVAAVESREGKETRQRKLMPWDEVSIYDTPRQHAARILAQQSGFRVVFTKAMGEGGIEKKRTLAVYGAAQHRQEWLSIAGPGTDKIGVLSLAAVGKEGQLGVLKEKLSKITDWKDPFKRRIEAWYYASRVRNRYEEAQDALQDPELSVDQQFQQLRWSRRREQEAHKLDSEREKLYPGLSAVTDDEVLSIVAEEVEKRVGLPKAS